MSSDILDLEGAPLYNANAEGSPERVVIPKKAIRKADTPPIAPSEGNRRRHQRNSWRHRLGARAEPPASGRGVHELAPYAAA